MREEAYGDRGPFCYLAAAQRARAGQMLAHGSVKTGPGRRVMVAMVVVAKEHSRQEPRGPNVRAMGHECVGFRGPGLEGAVWGFSVLYRR